MKSIAVLMTVLAACLCFGVQTSMAQADLGSVALAAIKSMQIHTSGANYYADVVVVIQNKGKQTVRLKDYEFDVKFKQNGETTPFGTAPLDEAVVPAGSGEGTSVTPGQLETTLKVDIGPEAKRTTKRLIKLFNILGNPSNTLNLVLEGSGEVGTKLPNGWASQTGIKLELEFIPTIQREVLFK